MPRFHAATTTSTRVEFVASVPLDLVNAMYFTSLAGQLEGIEDWPARVRREMQPELRDELDFLFGYPADPGIMGAVNDSLFAHREAWTDLDALLGYVREMPAGVGQPPSGRGSRTWPFTPSAGWLSMGRGRRCRRNRARGWPRPWPTPIWTWTRCWRYTTGRRNCGSACWS